MTKVRHLAAVLSLLVVAGCGGEDRSSATSGTSTPEVTATTIAAGADFDGLVPVEGHEVHLVCQGVGSPTVMIEMGAGQTVSNWNGTQPVLAESRRTCVYERAGTGDSGRGAEPRTAQVIADELHGLIEAAGLETPIVLLSHSLGGMDAQAFAQQYPNDVAGLVFVEPRTADYQMGYRDNLTEDELGIDDRDIEDMVANAPFGAEVAVADDSAAAVVEAGDLPDVPVVVLSAAVGFPEQSDADRAFWLRTHRDLAAQVADGSVIVVDGADHEIWRSHRDIVVDAVAEVVAAA